MVSKQAYGEWTEQELELLTMARDLDRLADYCIRASEHIAERCTEYAKGITRSGIVDGDNTPMGYSTCDDLVRYAAQSSVLWPVFKGRFMSVTGKSFADARKAAGRAG